MSGATAIIIATEEEEAEAQLLRASITGKGFSLSKQLDSDMAACAADLQAIKARIIDLRQRTEAE